MIYSQFALFMLRVFNMANRVILTPDSTTTTMIISEHHSIYSSTFGGLVHSTRAAAVAGSGEGKSEEMDAQASSRTRMRRILGDVQIGALFPIHKKKKGSESCGEIWEQYGIHRTEIALKTIEEINNDNSILPNVRLGIDIRDDCWTERTAMEEAIEFIRESIGSAPTATDSNGVSCDAKSTNNQTKLILAAVVGPGNSDMSIATHNLLQVFRIPQVGYSATTDDLSDKGDFKYYMRLVPSDEYQARALVDIAVHFKWTYIAVIYSNGNYGEKGFEQMQSYIERAANLCVAYTEKIDSLAPAQRFDELLNSLLTLKQRPRGDTMRRIFEATKRRRLYSYGNETDTGIQWIGSESWSDRHDVVAGYEDVATGGISLRIYSPRVESFDPYYWKLKPSTNSHNPWFVDFWEERFNCSLSAETAHRYSKKCTGEEDLSNRYIQDPKLSQVINCIYTVAYGLDAMYRNVCSEYTGRGLCPAMRKLDGSKLFSYMRNVRFNDSHGQEIAFDDNGDPPARYDILSFNGKGYVLAGEWRSIISVNENGTTYRQNLTVLADKWMWYDGTFAKDHIIESICNKPCQLGHIKRLQSTKACCWTCVRCLDNEYVADETTCRNCSEGYWPTDNRTSCYKLEVEYLRSTSPEAIVVTVLSCLGVLATLYTTFIFARFNATPVVKATTRELSYIILVGIFLCYSTTFVIVIEPNTITCYILRILPGFTFSMIYGALLTKTNRIARILAGSKKRILTKKPRFLSTKAQVVITFVLVGVESVIIASVLIYEPARAYYDYRIPRRVLLVCETSTLSFLAPFGFDFFLITLCTLYAVKTRNLPENFNEAKFIGFTMYTTCIIWLAFITIYFGSNNKGITMCLSFTLSASVALVLLFFPKLYIILFQPHKNVRSSYATTKVIRCHFGTNRSSTHSHSAIDNHSWYKPRSSSGPKTTSSVSRPSSKTSLKNELPSVTDSGSRLKKPYLRDSLHVTIPQTGPIVIPQVKESVLCPSPKDPSSTIINDLVTSSLSTRQFRSPLYFHNELSVIEESMMSHDDSLQSQGPVSIDQIQHHVTTSHVSTGATGVRSQECQTDPVLFEEYVKYWLLQQHCLRVEELEAEETAEERAISDRKRSSSLHSSRRMSAAARNQEGMEEKPYEFKRTYTEYRKGSKRIRRPDGSRLKIPRQSSVIRRSVPGDREGELNDQLATLISGKHPWRSEASIDWNDSVSDLPFLMRVNDLAPIDAVITSSMEEFKRKNTLKRRNRSQQSIIEDVTETETGQEGIEVDENLQTKPLDFNTPFGDIMAHTLGGAFQTFIGAAVPVDEKANFYITTQVIEEADEEVEKQDDKPPSLLGQTLESCLEALVLPAGKDCIPTQLSIDTTGVTSPKRLDRKGSLLSRLGHSIRKKIRRFSGDAAFEEFNTMRRFESHNSIGEPSFAEDFETSVALADLTEYTEEPEESGPAPHYRNRRSLKFGSTKKEAERQFEHDEEDEGTVNRRPKDRSVTTSTMASDSSPLIPSNIAVSGPSGDIGTSTDVGFVDAGNSSTLESLLQSQGLEPRDFSHSTLV